MDKWLIVGIGAVAAAAVGYFVIEKSASASGQQVASSSSSQPSTLSTAIAAAAAGQPYSSGSSGYSSFGVQQPGGSTSYMVLNNSLNQSTNNEIAAVQGNGQTLYSSNAIAASAPNTVVGYVSSSGTVNQVSSQNTTPVYAAGSAYQGPGEYISKSGAPEYIGTLQDYNSQAQFL